LKFLEAAYFLIFTLCIYQFVKKFKEWNSLSITGSSSRLSTADWLSNKQQFSMRNPADRSIPEKKVKFRN
jgi:hypothetical protein